MERVQITEIILITISSQSKIGVDGFCWIPERLFVIKRKTLVSLREFEDFFSVSQNNSQQN